MLTIAYIGFGNSVIRYHLPYIHRLSNIVVKSVFRRQEDRQDEREKQRELLYPTITFTSDLNQILQDPAIQCVIINTPDDTHSDYAKQVLHAGKHVLVEKPFALSALEAKEVFDLAKSKNLICTVNQNRRYDGDFLTLKKVLDSKVLGDIVDIESHYDYFRPHGGQVKPGWFLYSLAVHTIDQMVSLFGLPDHVHYDIRAIKTQGGEDYFNLGFFYGNMKVTISTSQYVKIDNPRFLVHGTKGSFVKPPQGHLSSKKLVEPIIASFDVEDQSQWGRLSYMNDQQESVDELVTSCVTDYGLIYQDLVDMILHGKPKKIKDEDVIGIIEILEKGTEIIKQNFQ